MTESDRQDNPGWQMSPDAERRDRSSRPIRRQRRWVDANRDRELQQRVDSLTVRNAKLERSRKHGSSSSPCARRSTGFGQPPSGYGVA